MTHMITALAGLGAGLAAAAVAGWLLNRRSGVVRASDGPPGRRACPDLGELGLSGTGPTVVHFSAPWCGPCASVRRVVTQVCHDLGDIAHLEIDMEANPTLAQRLSVLSLPTTFIFDADGRQRYRTAGVPKAADLRSALQALLA
jgi:thiol-disulfide isomerase/thioredoxin